MSTSTFKIRVFIVDDHTMIRQGLVSMIAGEEDLELVGEAVDGREALAQIPQVKPDVVLMDLLMPEVDGSSVIEALHARLPTTRFVVLTSQVNPEAVRRAIDAGATGYLLKTASAQELVTVIRNVQRGRRILAPEATDALVEAGRRRTLGADLTARERDVLALMTEGLSNQDIADRANITVPTVKFHVTNILGKLQADNRTEAVLIALQHKLVSPKLL